MGLMMDYVYTMENGVEYTIRQVSGEYSGLSHTVLSKDKIELAKDKDKNIGEKFELSSYTIHDYDCKDMDDAIDYIKKIEIERYLIFLDIEMDRYNFAKYFENKKNK